MLVGSTVLFEGGEGLLISVIAGVATINTASGVKQLPAGEIREAPVKVVELTDSVKVEEELTVLPAPMDDGDREEHAAERAAEDTITGGTSGVIGVVTNLKTSLDEPGSVTTIGNDKTYAPPGAEATSDIPDAPKDFIADLDKITGGQALPSGEPEVAPEADVPEASSTPPVDTPPSPEEPSGDSDDACVLPARITKKWLGAQSIEFLERAVLVDDTPVRIAKLQEALNRKRAAT